MKSVSGRILDIFEKYYIERAAERCENIITYAHEFLSTLDYDVEGYYVDEGRISKAIDSYFLDVIKYKEYHFSAADNISIGGDAWDVSVHVHKKINDSKVAAFTAKWLLKASPIYVVQKKNKPITDDILCHINEFFVLNCVLYALLQDNFHLLDEDDYQKLFYDFKYRCLDDRAYFSRFELIEKNIRCKKEIASLKDTIKSGVMNGDKEKIK